MTSVRSSSIHLWNDNDDHDVLLQRGPSHDNANANDDTYAEDAVMMIGMDHFMHDMMDVQPLPDADHNDDNNDDGPRVHVDDLLDTDNDADVDADAVMMLLEDDGPYININDNDNGNHANQTSHEFSSSSSHRYYYHEKSWHAHDDWKALLLDEATATTAADSDETAATTGWEYVPPGMLKPRASLDPTESIMTDHHDGDNDDDMFWWNNNSNSSHHHINDDDDQSVTMDIQGIEDFLRNMPHVAAEVEGGDDDDANDRQCHDPAISISPLHNYQSIHSEYDIHQDRRVAAVSVSTSSSHDDTGTATDSMAEPKNDVASITAMTTASLQQPEQDSNNNTNNNTNHDGVGDLPFLSMEERRRQLADSMRRSQVSRKAAWKPQLLIQHHVQTRANLAQVLQEIERSSRQVSRHLLCVAHTTTTSHDPPIILYPSSTSTTTTVDDWTTATVTAPATITTTSSSKHHHSKDDEGDDDDDSKPSAVALSLHDTSVAVIVTDPSVPSSGSSGNGGAVVKIDNGNDNKPEEATKPAVLINVDSNNIITSMSATTIVLSPAEQNLAPTAQSSQVVATEADFE